MNGSLLNVPNQCDLNLFLMILIGGYSASSVFSLIEDTRSDWP